MNKIKVKILNNNFDGMPLFLAKLTQRGSQINSIDDLMKLYKDNIDKTPSKDLLSLPHDTISRMCTMTVAIYGLSTKAVSQLRTHAKRMSCISTSTQYSEFTNQVCPYVVPEGLGNKELFYKLLLDDIHQKYKTIFNLVQDNDIAGYLLPQSLRKCFIMSANFPDWRYILSLRLCNRNTREVQYVCQLILQAINDDCGKIWADMCLPKCVDDKCPEGKFCCGRKYEDVRK